MSRSSAASRLSSAGSSLQSWFEEQFAPAMRWFGELPFVVALREALPWSFLALLAALLVFIPFTPAPGPIFSRSFGLRLSGAFLPSFGIMGMALVPLLAWRYALRAKVPSPPLDRGGRLRLRLVLSAARGHRVSFAAGLRREQPVSRDRRLRTRRRRCCFRATAGSSGRAVDWRCGGRGSCALFFASRTFR